MNIKGKKITILGAVRSGIGAAKLAKKFSAFPFVSDLSPEEKIQENVKVLRDNLIEFECGGHSKRVFDCDLIVTSPGVPTDSEVLQEAFSRKIEVVSELEFAAWFCKGKIIGITGTNGKTTTTSLCEYTFNICGKKTTAAGNIGLAFSEITDTFSENDFAVVEISSFQLDFIKTFKPYISVILNITPDHLDRYEHDVKKYAASKMKIGENQGYNDYYIFNADDKGTPELNKNSVKKYSFSITNKIVNGAYAENSKIYFSENGKAEEIMNCSDLSLKGEHNLANALAVLAIAKITGCNNDGIIEAFKSFPGVEHRLEFVREINGIKFINDSKATNVDSVWYALRSFNEPLFLILGGKDKGNDYKQIEEEVRQRVKKIYAIGSSAEKVKNYFENIVPVEIKNSLGECVNSSLAEAQKGDVLLLSPACASFDMFKSYEDRGKQFKDYVKNI